MQGEAPRDDSGAVAFARFIADLLDRRFTVPGTSIRIGLDPIIGLIPGIGDAIANLAGSLILFIAARLGIPRIVLFRMAINIAVNAIIGSIPLLGDVFSVWFRSNVYNLQLLEKHIGAQGRRSTVQDWLFVIGILIVLAVIFAGSLIALVYVLKRLWTAL